MYLHFYIHLIYHLLKLILNLTLVSNPAFGVNGAAWASVACHVVAFTISIICLKKAFRLKLPASKFVIKPFLATIIMAICSYFIYYILSGIIALKLATILAIVFAVIIYVLAVIALKVFTKEEVLMMPAGDKISKLLTKLKIY